MEQKDAKKLLDKYRLGRCTDEERQWVEDRFNQYIGNNDQLPSQDDWLRVQGRMRGAVLDRGERRTARRQLLWLSAAAATLIIAATAWFFFPAWFTVQHTPQLANLKTADIDPGRDRAVLTLADGRKIQLDEAENGKLAVTGGMRVEKTAEGELVYEADGSGAADVTESNTIETPRGGQFKVVLPDGTAVWLNASSSLTYPTRFAEDERRVALRGEAYFEVANRHRSTSPGKRVPFLVETANQQVEVLGTHFNLNAYADEPDVRTTLVEGAVRISAKGGALSLILRPGEQCVFTGETLAAHAVDPESVVAWKNNMFLFYRVDLPAVIRQIERWYDVEFDTENLPSDIRLYGEIGKDKKLSVVLDALSANTGLHFELRGRRVAVTK